MSAADARSPVAFSAFAVAVRPSDAEFGTATGTRIATNAIPMAIVFGGVLVRASGVRHDAVPGRDCDERRRGGANLRHGRAVVEHRRDEFARVRIEDSNRRIRGPSDES